jgi:hypothetical protein
VRDPFRPLDVSAAPVLNAPRIVKDEHVLPALARLTSYAFEEPDHEEDHRDNPEQVQHRAGYGEENARNDPENHENDREINEGVHIWN